jgi:hypothetical protein
VTSCHPAEAFAAFAIAVSLGLAALLAASAGLAGLVFGSGWASGSLADMPGVAARLPQNLADPRGAWPADARSRLPAAPGFYAAALVVVSATALAGTAGLAAYGRFRSIEGARWATPGSLRSLHAGRSRRDVSFSAAIGGGSSRQSGDSQR